MGKRTLITIQFSSYSNHSTGFLNVLYYAPTHCLAASAFCEKNGVRGYSSLSRTKYVSKRQGFDKFNNDKKRYTRYLIYKGDGNSAKTIQ